MLSGLKLEFLQKYNNLLNLAKEGNEKLPDLICNFLVSEFELESSVIFKVNKDNLAVIGRSSSARKIFLNGTTINFDINKIFNTLSGININTEVNTELQVSEFLIYEASILFPSVPENFLLARVAKKTPFSKSDIDGLKNVFEFVSNIFEQWVNLKGGQISVSKKSFSQTMLDTFQELRNPINSIIGFTSILSSDNLTSSQADYTLTIKKNSQDLLVAINDLIELTKIDSGNVSETLTPVNLKEFVQSIVDIFASKANKELLQYRLEIANNIPEVIHLDAQKLKNILNTILNFSSISTLQGTVLVSINSSNANNLIFTIKDSGRGIPSNLLSNIFAPFEIKKVEEFKNSSISGLSFTLLEKQVELLGGKISLTSTLGEGTQFVFEINCKMESKKEAPKNIVNQLSSLPAPTKELNSILVIEDDYATSKLLSNYLNKWGYNPTIVNTEQQTFEAIEKEKFLAIILDINLPNTNGLELLKRIHENPKSKTTPTIVCSVEPEEQKAFMMGAVEYFQKPINYNYLVEVLTSYKLRKNSNVLCVDDDLPTLNLVKQAIETAGFNAVAEHISANVMNLIKDKDIDLAIVDLEMPHPNGFELIKLIKSEEKFKNLPIIIYTGKENLDEDLHKIDGLFEELLSKKSNNIEDLAETINAMINNKYEKPSTVEEVKDKKDVIKILLAEDYKHSQIIVTRLLKKNGFENVVVVENGQEALNMSKEEHFDLFLMDMQMPIMNGFEAMEKLRETEEYKDTPIIALTAFAMKGDREKCLEAGATDYIPKPIDSKEFIEKVKYYTGK